MTIDAARTVRQGTAAPWPANPVAFDGLFGWFSPGVHRRGVVLCGTLGFEQLSAHRAWAHLAGRIAATGCATLRFDYPGEGDSGDLGAGRLEALTASIGRAVRFLREEAGAEEIVLVGLRLGGTLAALAADACGADRLVLLAPFAGGRAYLREMRLRARTLDCLPDGTPIPQDPENLTVGGFRLGPDLMADLAAADLAGLAQAPAPHVLLLGADVGGIAARCTELGSAVTTAPFPGLAPLVAGALFSEVPEAAFETVAAFAADGAGPAPAAQHAPVPAGPIGGPGWSEVPTRFGDGLFGILCRPERAARGAPAVLFVSSGRNARSGHGRQTVALARGLARAGVPSLRIDLRGIGDSPDRPDGASPLYALDAVDEVRAGLDRLEALHAGPLVVVGLCSGAFLGFHALCRDARIRAGVLVNLYCFDWDPAHDVETIVRKPFRSAAAYAGLLRRGEAWRRLLRGEIRVGAILARLARRQLKRLGRTVGRLMRPRSCDATVAGRIAALRRRGATLVLVYSAGEPGLAEMHAHLGRTPAAAARRLGRPVEILDRADHSVSTLAALDRLRTILHGVIAEVRAAG